MPGHLLREPTSTLLTLGGDTRILVDPRTGLNSYGCGTEPVSEPLMWGSCSASSPTSRAFAEAERTHRALQSAADQGRLTEKAEALAHTVREGILKFLGLGGDVHVMLAPSATDTEYVPLALALGDGSRAVTNVLVSARETGSGTGVAAHGQHTSERLPSGTLAERGAFLEGFPPEQFRVVNVPLRDEHGQKIPRSKLEARAAEAVAEAAKRGDRIVVHGLDCSKTGLRGLDPAFLASLAEDHDDEVLVVIDAAQFRVSPATVREHLRHGQIVMLSGSKFFGGPPFSGAVLLPDTPLMQRRMAEARPPEGFADYFTRADVPAAWTALRERMPSRINAGLCLRWASALAEMEAYRRVPAVRRAEILRTLIADVHDHVERSPHLVLDEDKSYAGEHGTKNGEVESDVLLRSTITSFRVRRLGGGFLGYKELRRCYARMYHPIADYLPEWAANGARSVAARPYVLGQPVHVAPAVSVLRLALSAPIVVRAARGGLDAEHKTLGELFAKLNLVVEDWDHIGVPEKAVGQAAA